MASETVVHIHTFMFYHMHTVCNSVVLKYFIGFPLYLNFWWVFLRNLHEKMWMIHSFLTYVTVLARLCYPAWNTLFLVGSVFCISVLFTAGCWRCINIVNLYLFFLVFTSMSYLYVPDCPVWTLERREMKQRTAFSPERLNSYFRNFWKCSEHSI